MRQLFGKKFGKLDLNIILTFLIPMTPATTGPVLIPTLMFTVVPLEIL